MKVVVRRRDGVPVSYVNGQLHVYRFCQLLHMRQLRYGIVVSTGLFC